jgi:hypothetical protein
VIRERFDRYMDLPAMKVETMRPAQEVAAAIHARLAADAPDALRAALRTRPPGRGEARAHPAGVS